MMKIEKVTGVLNVILLSFFIIWCTGWLFTGAWYCNPNAEDLSLTSLPRDIGIIPSSMDVMSHYDGRYFTNILHGLNPLAFNWLQGYKLMPVFGVIFLVVSFYFFANTLFVAKSKWMLLLYAGLFATVHFATAPSLPHDLYWMVSAFVYLYPAAFTFLWLGSYIRYIHVRPNEKSIGWFIATVIFLFACIGLNEMFLVSNFILLLVLAVIAVFASDRNVLWKTLPVLLIGFACITFFVASPGISDRAATQHDPNAGVLNVGGIVHAVKDYEFTFGYLLVNGLCVFSSLIILLSFDSVSFRYKIIEEASKPWILGLITLSLFGVSVLMALAFYIPMQINVGYPARVFDSTNIFLQLVFFVTVPLLAFHYKSYDLFKSILPYKNYVIFVLLWWMIAGIFFSNNNIARIKREYTSGKLQKFDQTMKTRFAAINSARQSGLCWQAATVDSIIVPNSTIFYSPELGSNRNPVYWNLAYEIFFKVDEVKREGDTARKVQ